MVMDTTLGREVSLLETAKEFVRSFRLKNPHLVTKKGHDGEGGGAGNGFNGSGNKAGVDEGTAEGSDKESKSDKTTEEICGSGTTCCGKCDGEKSTHHHPHKTPVVEHPISLPFLTSNCPGWICYAEKTQTSKLLQHISSVKSPQQIVANILKSYLATKLTIPPSNIYHVSVAPCYDKKLEATRADFVLAGGTDDEEVVKEVDCVLSTSRCLLEFRCFRSRGVYKPRQ